MRHLAQVRADVREALEEARSLASRIHPALEAGGLGPALRAAAADTGVRTRIDVEASASIPPEVAGAVYFCCLEVWGRAADTELTITVREELGGVAFEIVADGDVDAERSALRDRVEALGGSVAIRSEPGPRTVWAGFLPLER
jgi:signal transduction histidine kinase